MFWSVTVGRENEVSHEFPLTPRYTPYNLRINRMLCNMRRVPKSRCALGFGPGLRAISRHLRRMHRFDQSIRALGLYAVEIAGSGMISRQVWRISGHSGREPSRIPIYNGIAPRRIGQKQACRAFPDHQGGGIASGPERNFQILSLLDFLAEFTQHIPAKGSHPIRYHGSCCFPVEFTISSL